MKLKIQKIETEISSLEKAFFQKIEQTSDVEGITKLEIEYLGKNSILLPLFNQMKTLSLEEKKNIGAKINAFKAKANAFLQKQKTYLENEVLIQTLKKEKIDVTWSAWKFNKGNIHPLNQIIYEIEDFFLQRGYSIYDGTEIETDLYNFEMLNMDKNHPARNMQDSFYLSHDEQSLLRTHTSAVQIKAILKHAPQPLKIISHGKVYRRDKDDDTHSHQFTQLEGFAIDKSISIRDLKQILVDLIKYIFGPNQKLRFRPSYFPFTKPSLEVDLVIDAHNNQSIYLEILGAGLIHPQVLKRGNYDPQKYSGFAFGIGIERIAMLKYQIKDIRHFYNNDILFLSQFMK